MVNAVRWLGLGVAMWLALWSEARAGFISCSSRPRDWLVEASGSAPDRELATRLTSAALQYGDRDASVTLIDGRTPPEPTKGSCVGLARVNVRRGASGVAVELSTRRFDELSWDEEAKVVEAGPDLVTALENALVAAKVRSGPGMPLVAFLPPPPCSPSRTPVFRALLVGIDEYAKGLEPSLLGAVRDTSLLEAALRVRAPRAEITKLLNREATRAGLHRALTALVEATGCGDVVFVHFSGNARRGALDGSDGFDVAYWDSGRVALSLSDQRLMGESTLRGFVTALRNRRAAVVLSLDTHHTAGVNLCTTWRHWSLDGVELLRGAGECAVMTAGLFALEFKFEDGPAGLYSLALALALQKEGSPTMRSLAAGVDENVRRLAKDRTKDPAPYFEATNPDAPFLSGPRRATAALEVRLDGEEEHRGAALLALPAAPEDRKVTLSGAVTGAEALSALLVNGKRAELGTDGRFRVELELRPGRQKVELIGVRPDSSLIEATREVQLGAEGAALPGKSYALLIGIQQYEKWSPLQTPVADVREVARVLRERYGFQTTLASFGDLVLENADKVRIGSAFVALRRGLGPSDSLLVYFAGHGAAGGPKERRYAYWIPREGDQENRATWYAGQELLSEIAMPEMRARHVLVLSDSCFSGDLTRDRPNPPADLSDAERERRLTTAASQVSRILITSGYDEPVLDGGGGGHSVFARALIDGLDRMPEERFLSFDLFSRFIDQQVGGKSPQRPHHWYLKDSGHDGGDMPFFRRRAGP